MKIWVLVLTAVTLIAQPVDRLDWLRQEIARHDALYFQKAEPEITDYEYDLLKAELRELEAEVALESSERVGSDLHDAAAAVRHGKPMLSLEKAYGEADIRAFVERLRKSGLAEDAWLVIEPKYDGVAINVHMVRGQVEVVTTRGDGESGQVVTDLLEALTELSYGWTAGEAEEIEAIELRGEVFISHAAFADLNARRRESGEVEFRHPRSVAAGALSLNDEDEVKARNLSLVFHGWGAVEPADAAPQSVTAFHEWMAQRGLPRVVGSGRIQLSDTDGLEEAVARVRAGAAAFPTDGVVLKVDEVAEQDRLGNGATAPRWAIARKFVPPREETTLRRIVWQVGRTGVLTPVAEFDAVELDGTTVARASLHNARELVSRDLRIGDKITVEKAGEIIPSIVDVHVEARSVNSVPLALPETCPACGGALARGESSAVVRCANANCGDQVVLRLMHFASRNAVGIRGIGAGLARKLVEGGLVNDASDLYGLSEEQLRKVPGVGAVLARRLVEAIDGSRSAPRWKILVGLGVSGLGPAGAKKVAPGLEKLSDLLDDSKQAMALAVLGAAARGQVRDALNTEAVRALIERLDAAGLGRK